MRLFIEPMEPLLLRRTGRSFSAGESGYADSLFPPTPETLQGAIRAAIATHWNETKTLAEAFRDENLVSLIGDNTPNNYGRFRITEVALGRRKTDGTIERLFPAPAYLQKDKQGIVRFNPDPMNDVISNIPDDMQYLIPDRKTEHKLKPVGWLTERGLLKALWTKEEITKEEIVRNDDIFTDESRLGIWMNNTTKTTREGLLYQMSMVRMNHKIGQEHTYGFMVDIGLTKSPENEEAATDPYALADEEQTQELLKFFPKDGWVTFGGERRAARFEVYLTGNKLNSLTEKKSGTLLYLATPAAFRAGWQPEQWSAPLTRPIAAAIERYTSIGGWRLNPGNSGGTNKSTRRCVPAGSVYFFDEPVTITKPLTDYGWQIGYGIAYTGDWKK